MASMTMRMRIPTAAPVRGLASRVARRRIVLRAQEAPKPTSEQPTISEPIASTSSRFDPQPAPEQPLLGRIQEAVNGRAAMLGMTAAVLSEFITHQTVWSQLAGRYENLELIEKPIGQSSLLYFAVVVLVIVASVAPKIISDEGPDSRNFGPFTPSLENTLGRVAMLAFPLLLVTEGVVHAAVF